MLLSKNKNDHMSTFFLTERIFGYKLRYEFDQMVPMRLKAVRHRFDGPELVMQRLAPQWETLATKPAGSTFTVKVHGAVPRRAAHGELLDPGFEAIRAIIPWVERDGSVGCDRWSRGWTADGTA